MYRFLQQCFQPSSPTEIHLDPVAIEQARAQSAYRLHAKQIPVLRAFGLGCVTLFVLLHNVFILQEFSWSAWAQVVAIVAAYVSTSWLILWRWYPRVKRFDLGLFFLGFDIIILTLLIYVSGGNKSWLFFVLMARTADQANTTSKRTVVFAHLATLGYVLMIVYLQFVEQRPISWTIEGTKSFIIYVTNLYIASAAQASEHLRRRLATAVRLARHLLAERQQAEEALRSVQEDLEARVTARTTELEQANAALQEEVSKRLQAQDELLRIRNIESLGVLAGGIAHDFNNVLNGIMGYVSLARLRANNAAAVAQSLEQAEKACQRAASLAQQLIAFATGGAPVRQTTHLAKTIQESTEAALRDTAVQYTLEVATDLWPVDVDCRQMQQAFEQLLNNAKRAMPHGGLVAVQASNVHLTDNANLPLAPGRYIKLTIADQGHGIPAEQISKIFDPYFTTNQPGSGLGLTTAHAIIRKHEGHISVTSVVGQGTTFAVYLPASASTLSLPPAEPLPPPPGQGRILVMDDEEMIRSFLDTLLSRLGYQVSLAQDGAEAVMLYRKAQEAGHPFTAVILDLTVTNGMGGQEAMAQLRSLDPQVKGIVSSGYSNNPIMANFQQYGFCAVVAKPYTIADLSLVLQRIAQTS